jgi:hypothetical protein
LLGGFKRRFGTWGNQKVNLSADDFGGNLRESGGISFRGAKVKYEVLSFGITKLTQFVDHRLIWPERSRKRRG